MTPERSLAGALFRACDKGSATGGSTLHVSGLHVAPRRGSDMVGTVVCENTTGSKVHRSLVVRLSESW